MKTISECPVQEAGLTQLVDKLINSSSILAIKNRSLVINEVPTGLNLTTNIDVVSSIISGLIQSLVAQSKDSCIRVSAKIFSNVIVMHIKDSNSFNNCVVGTGLQDMQPLVQKIKGYVAITSYRMNQTTIAFSFPNL